MAGCVGLRFIFRRDRKLLLDLADFLRCMFPEETLHVRRKFTQKIGYRIRAQAASKAIQLFCSELANKAPRNSDVLAKSRTYFVSTKESMSEAAKITR